MPGASEGLGVGLGACLALCSCLKASPSALMHTTCSLGAGLQLGYRL